YRAGGAAGHVDGNQGAPLLRQRQVSPAVAAGIAANFVHYAVNHRAGLVSGASADGWFTGGAAARLAASATAPAGIQLAQSAPATGGSVAACAGSGYGRRSAGMGGARSGTDSG